MTKLKLSLNETRLWCSTAHGSQKYGPNFYSFHLRQVELVALRFGFSSIVIRKACWLHDVIEDTRYTKEFLLSTGFFGVREIEIAFAVSDEPGKDRKERKARTYPKIRQNRDAVIVKLCDRIANVEYATSTNSHMIAVYQSEYAEFRSQLMDPRETRVLPMWQHLDELLKTAHAA